MLAVTLTGAWAWLFVGGVAVVAFVTGWQIRAEHADRREEIHQRSRLALCAQIDRFRESAELAQAAAEYWKAEAATR